VAAAAGYAEGARLAPLLGADQVICWALLLSLPLVLPLLVLDVARSVPTAGAAAWSCFAYTAVVSMFLGFFAWYRGLELGGVAKISQVQLAQPLLTVAASVLCSDSGSSRRCWWPQRPCWSASPPLSAPGCGPLPAVRAVPA
jgi:drug/metabolite transporter (DMT)-like permease